MVDAKREAIRNAYGEYWDKMSPELQEIALSSNGWIRMRDCIKELGEEFSVYSDDLETESIEYAVFKQRPISLQGIENNNGWIMIESEEDLPTENSGLYFVYDGKDVGIARMSTIMFRCLTSNEAYSDVTHYQPIVKPEKPIY